MLHVGQIRHAPPSHVEQGSARLDGRDPCAAAREIPRRLPGAAADLEHPAQLHVTGQVGEEPLRVARANPVVELGVLVEGGRQRLALRPSGHTGQRACPEGNQ